MSTLPLAIPTTLSAADAIIAARAPIIGYNNHFDSTDATVSASSEDATDGPYEFAYDGLPSTHWMPDDGTQYLTATFSAAKSANYFAFYATDLATNTGTIVLQYSTNSGSTWTDCFTAISVGSSAPCMETFTAIFATYWRVKVVSTPGSIIGVVSFGNYLQLPYGDWIGFAPPKLARDNVVQNNTSHHGNLLGRSMIRQGVEFSLSLDYFSQAFMRESWIPFLVHAEQKPFFLKWNPGDWPCDTAFCWTEGPVDSVRFSKPDKMGTSLRCHGRVD
jgi:hypothetical protein